MTRATNPLIANWMSARRVLLRSGVCFACAIPQV
jgi:hypothetical protein